jgi:hypothetical protein
MATLKEQIDLIQQNQEENEQLEKELQNILYKQQDLISTGLENNLSATKSIDGYTIKMTPENIKHNPFNKCNAYEIIIEEPFKTREPLRYVKAITKIEPKAVSDDDKLLNIRCTIQENNQRLDHRQIIDYITQTFGV